MDADLSKYFDLYNLKARVYPALMAAAPIAVSVILLWPASPLSALWPVAISVGVLMFLSTWVRGRGQVIEQRLAEARDGLPTTQMLRLRGGQELPSLHRRRTLLMATVNIVLPTADDERANPASADNQYVIATRALIVQLRRMENVNPLVHEEGVQYGFRRNLYAMKTLAVPLVIAALAADVCWFVVKGFSAGTAVSACVHVLMLGIWVFVVRLDWVWRQGQTYAERLFETLEDNSLRNARE